MTPNKTLKRIAETAGSRLAFRWAIINDEYNMNLKLV